MTRLSLSLLFLAIYSLSTWGQSITGLAPFAPLQGGGVESVNLANLNVHMSIPVLHKKGRGFDFAYVLNYDSTIWTTNVCVYNCINWTPVPNWGWQGVSASTVGYIVYSHLFNNVACPNSTLYNFQAYYDNAGTLHKLYPVAAYNLCWPASGVNYPSSSKFTTNDGSGYSMNISVANNVISITNFFDKGGNAIVAPVFDVSNGYPPTTTNGSGSITDPNGNKISTNGAQFTDTLGMNVLTVSGTNPVSYGYTGPSTTPEAVKVNYSTYTVATSFNCASIIEFPPTQVNLVSSVSLPDGSSYTFTYETVGGYYTGRIAKVELPTGGTISYQYTGSNNGIMCADGTPAGLTRTLSDGSVWQYARSTSGTTTTVTDPAQNQTVIQTNNGAAVETQKYQGSSTAGTLLQTVTTCYSVNPAPCSTPTGPVSNTTPGAITVVTLPQGGQSSQVVSYLTPQTIPSEIDLYDFGASSPMQKELISYASLANGVNNRVVCDQVLAGSTVPTSCGTVTSNTKSLNTASYDSLGNLQGTSSWVSGVSTPQYLNRSFQNYSNGLLHIATDVNSNQTTYLYQNCNNTPAYPSSISSGGLITSMTWDCDGGVLTQFKDANSQPTNIGYVAQGSGAADPFWRVMSVTDPLLNTTWNTYTATTAETALIFNNNLSGSDVLTTLDGLGRLSLSQVRTAPGSSTFDNTIQYGYGWTTTGTLTGPFATETVPGGTALTTAQRDPLGRVAIVTDGGGGTMSMSYSSNDVLRSLGPAANGENPKNRQVQYDALGRVTSVCEILSSGGTSCGQNTSASGYQTSYTYAVPTGGGEQVGVAQGVQSRNYVRDGEGRLLTSTDPESGTSNAVYDSESSCGSNGAYSSNGDLLMATDARGISNCYYYDLLHRLTDVGNSAQSTVNPCKRLRYDNTSGVLGSIPVGVAVSNTKGRLAEAETDTCLTPITQSSMITDEWFSYDLDGRLTDVYELTPHSGGYYHTTVGYFPSGALSSLTLPVLGTYTYNVDGEGRSNTASNGATTFINGVTYNAASQPIAINTGKLGDQDNYTYDPATGRMTGYTFTVNSISETGVLRWNQNSTLQQLAITDGFDSGGTQTCNYLYLSLIHI